MGILNVTPDSFSDGGRFFAANSAVARALEIATEGADILDVGGESTRPGSERVPAEEEIRRIAPVLESLAAAKYPLPISIDTSKPEVARAALERGAVVVNDITALNDPAMGEVAAAHGAAVVLMHMRGTPRTMQQIPRSPDILAELEQWSREALGRARMCGIAAEKIILDPGIGFGKSVDQNLEIIRNLDRLAGHGYPLMAGVSRKSFIGAVLGDAAKGRAWGTAAAVAASIIFGAHVVRVHDVGAMHDIVRTTDAIMASSVGE